MSEKDENKHLKDNAGRDLKPKEAARETHAPYGFKGTQPKAPGMAPTGPVYSGAEHAQATVEHQRSDREQSRQVDEQKADNRPSFEKTGDREVDQFYAKDNRMIAKDDDRQR